MKKKRDYQHPWTLPFGLMEEMGVLDGSIHHDLPTSEPSNISADTWSVEGAANPDVTLQDWNNNFENQ